MVPLQKLECKESVRLILRQSFSLYLGRGHLHLLHAAGMLVEVAGSISF